MPGNHITAHRRGNCSSKCSGRGGDESIHDDDKFVACCGENHPRHSGYLKTTNATKDIQRRRVSRGFGKVLGYNDFDDGALSRMSLRIDASAATRRLRRGSAGESARDRTRGGCIAYSHFPDSNHRLTCTERIVCHVYAYGEGSRKLVIGHSIFMQHVACAAADLMAKQTGNLFEVCIHAYIHNPQLSVMKFGKHIDR